MEKSARPNSQSGNMLVYILGAIFLLGILIVATKGNVQPGAGIDAESLSLKVSQVRKYGAELERGIGFIMQNGASETDIRFAYASALSTYGTYGTNPKAEVFNPLGGGVEWRDPLPGVQASVLPWVFNGTNRAQGMGCHANTANCADLVAILPDVTKQFCLQVNNSVGVTNPSGAPPQENDYVCVTPFAGTFAPTCALGTVPDYTSSRPEGCFEGKTGTVATGAAGHYYYYKVLMAR